jgi:LysM repeat protein
MKTYTVLRLCLIGGLALAACQRRPTPSPTAVGDAARSATLSEVVNIVEGHAAEAGEFAPVAVGFVAGAGGAVRTGADSRARLDLNDGTILRLAPLSSFTLQGLPASNDADPLTQLQLVIGKLWVNLTGGAVEVETPIGVATVRGSFAVFEYIDGDPADLTDDILIVSCLEGNCSATNATVSETLGNLEQVILSNGGTTVTRRVLTEDDVNDFLTNNPEAGRMVVTLTAAAPSATVASATSTLPPTETPTPSPPPITLTPSQTHTATPTRTATPTPTPAFVILGQHTVQPGETLLCIGRGYGILPQAIRQANGLTSDLILAGQTLKIPDAQWANITPGFTCAPQFNSPYPGLPTSTPAPLVSPTATATAPVSGATPTTVVSPPPVSTTPPADTTPPTIGVITANPTTVDQRSNSCTVTFQASLSDSGNLASASVTWQAYDAQGLPVTVAGYSGSPPMVFLSGTSTNAIWQAVVAVKVPPSGIIQWSVTATDASGNSSTAPSITPITASPAGC